MAPLRAAGTPPRRNPGRQARHSDEQSTRASPRNPYRTPTRVSARLRSTSISPATATQSPQQQQAPAQSGKRARNDRYYVAGESSNDETLIRGKRARPDPFKSRSVPVPKREDVHFSQHTDSDDAASSHGPDNDIHNEDEEYQQPGRRSGRYSKGAKSSPDHRLRRSPPKGTPSPRKAARTATAAVTTKIHKPEPQQQTIIPNWQGSLPYLVWVQILTYAAAGPGPFGISASWLVQTARVCQAIADPAITVLYRCPPVSTEHKAISLVNLLRRPPTRLRFNYRAKIKSLHINVLMVSLTPGSLAGPDYLVKNLPQLREIHIVHPLDAPPYRNLTQALRWNYHKELFDSLEVGEDASEERLDKTSPTRLESWIWNERMIKLGTYVPGLPKIMEIHATPSFTSLRRLRFINFQIPSFSTEERSSRAPPAHVQDLMDAKDRDYAQDLAAALAALPQLEYLAFESSTCVNPVLLPLLPMYLKHLELVNCWEIPSDLFASFLASHGSRMETLALHHNQALNLAFLTVLGHTCPRLKELRMNMFYYRHHEFLDDSDPFYDFLLLEDQIPNWPSTLQVIDMENLRGWSHEAANMFFQSLADSAKNLPDLRHLTVKAMLNISWRQRSEVRQGWQDKLRKIFLRPFVPPMTLTTLRPPPPKRSTVALSTKPEKPRTEPSRRSTRLTGEGSDSKPSRASGKTKGLRSLGRPQYEEPESDEFDEEMDLNEGGATGPSPDARSPNSAGVEQAATPGSSHSSQSEEGLFIHGLCDVVEISIDNQKPREQQYGMGDFVDELDTEGDETDGEWDGRAEYS